MENCLNVKAFYLRVKCHSTLAQTLYTFAETLSTHVIKLYALTQTLYVLA